MIPTLDRYTRGDLALVQCSEPDPVPGWPEHAEQHAHDLRSIRIGSELVCSFGYMLRSSKEADGFAVVDRAKARGHGPAIAQIIHDRQIQWMRDIMLARAWADCPRTDIPAMAFLRAIGYQRTQGPDDDRAFFILDLEPPQ